MSDNQPLNPPDRAPEAPSCPTDSDELTGSAVRAPLPQVILAALAADGYKPGQRTPSELELASRFGVGRPSIREALSALEALGFLEARKGSGRVLRPFDFGVLRSWLPYMLGSDGSGLLDLLRVRQVLEVNFLAAAAGRLGRGDLEQLVAVSDVMSRKAAAGETFVEEDHRFHTTLHQGSGNSVLTVIVNVYWDAFESISEPETPDPARLAETAEHHGMIARSLLAGDIAKAQYHMDAHFYDVAARLSEHHSHVANRPDPRDRPTLRMIPT